MYMQLAIQSSSSLIDLNMFATAVMVPAFMMVELDTTRDPPEHLRRRFTLYSLRSLNHNPSMSPDWKRSVALIVLPVQTMYKTACILHRLRLCSFVRLHCGLE